MLFIFLENADLVIELGEGFVLDLVGLPQSVEASLQCLQLGILLFLFFDCLN
jgi:hypothetical protein